MCRRYANIKIIRTRTLRLASHMLFAHINCKVIISNQINRREKTEYKPWELWILNTRSMLLMKRARLFDLFIQQKVHIVIQLLAEMIVVDSHAFIVSGLVAYIIGRSIHKSLPIWRQNACIFSTIFFCGSFVCRLLHKKTTETDWTIDSCANIKLYVISNNN